ncbi:sugar ABC transporter substrate-binding protein [Labrys miyagiensis]|uniref:Sugar ABC transporter substrate-binding protein n=1 Tax=Labrys miyagiensis TaxID=346912 RepID=A0ABQ6CKF2_9HYPH|nr:ABC transporter substrate-binding protein [Labrys miyagiensis]GLS19360.1 sugar ABC transporter substrate-binding protein [Labrys miyagiensis]
MKRNYGLAGASLIAALLAVSGAHAADKKFVVGVSNTLIGNGWREEMICSIKAQAEASGVVSKVVVANRNGGPSEQIADIRNLISAGANAIIINPSDRDALNPIIKQAAAKGIVVVAVDQSVSAPEAYTLSNDQVAYGKVGAKWLFDKLGGKGNVLEMRGIDGVPADADRHQGFTEALKDYPDIKVTSVFTGWALNKTAQTTKELLASGKQIDGIWTSGLDKPVVDAYQTAGKPFVPVVGADNNGFLGQLIALKDKGLSGVAVSNPPAVGGAGLALALDILQKTKDHPHVVKVTPTVWDNTDAGLDTLKKNYNPKLDPFYSVAVSVPGYTTYTMDQIIGCKGP